MIYPFIPDLIALATLIAILIFFRRGRSGGQVDIWLIGLSFIFIEALAHAYYESHGTWHRTLHVVQLDAYAIAGVVFTWSSGKELYSRSARRLYLILNAIPLLTLLTLYGLSIHTPTIYYYTAATGLVLGVITSLWIRRSPALICAHLAIWISVATFIAFHQWRAAAYWTLACLYLVAAIAFQQTEAVRFPYSSLDFTNFDGAPSAADRRSVGKVTILAGFLMWALCFLVHPFITHYPLWMDVASNTWDLQKFVISIGMVLVMLEEEVTANKYLALHDELTGLPNRRLFEDRLTHDIERSRRLRTRVGLLVIDIDSFKRVNDSLGHHAGDQMLRGFAQNLRDSVRTSDTLARLGGDEFVILVTDLADDFAVTRVLETISLALAKPILVAGNSIPLNASLGVAIYPDDAEDAIHLFELADRRMYESKDQTRPPAQPSLITPQTT